MQIGGGFLGIPITVCVVFSLLGLWLGHAVVRLIARRTGQIWATEDRLFRRRLALFSALCWIAAGALTAAALAVVPGLIPALEAKGFVQWGGHIAWAMAFAITALVSIAAVLSVVRAWTRTLAAIRRRRMLLGLEPIPGRRESVVAGTSQTHAQPASSTPMSAMPAAAAAPRTGGRRIVVCCDGTGNRPAESDADAPVATNVWKIYRGLVCNEAQTAWYDPGVATDTSTTATTLRRTRRVFNAVGTGPGGRIMAEVAKLRRAYEGATGAGLVENVAQAYAEIVRRYRPGDRIYLIGFSRGAYTARCVAGVIDMCGLLRPEFERYVPDLVYLYRTRRNPHEPVPIPDAMVQPQEGVRVEFLGLFDTVGSLGVPLWGWWFRALPHWNNISLSTDPMRVCRHVYHAMAMDERRAQFFPTPFSRPEGLDTTLEQVWFRGAHADVGGGYEETHLSDIALDWMVQAAERHGLEFDLTIREGRKPDPLALVHDELNRRPYWRLFGSWPRWHPVPGAENPPKPAPPGTLHPSVLERQRALEQELGRPDFLRLVAGAPVAFDVHAGREWNRSGVVLGAGYYRLSYVSGLWRNAEDEPCGPFGEDDASVGWWRRTWAISRRLPGQPWTRLCVAVAHPRRWKLRELGIWQLLRYQYWKDPKELRRQIAPIGRDLKAVGDSITIQNKCLPGLLYLFANDLWHTAGNNSGALCLEVEQVDAPVGGKPLWVLGVDGYWKRREGAAPLAEETGGQGPRRDYAS